MLKNYPYRDQDAGGTGGPVDREALRILRDQNEVLFQILGNTRQRTEAQKEFASLNNDITKQIKDQLLLKETDVALDQTTVRSKEELAKRLGIDADDVPEHLAFWQANLEAEGCKVDLTKVTDDPAPGPRRR